MTQIVEAHEQVAPVDVGLFGTKAEVQPSSALTDLVEQADSAKR